MNSVKCFWVPSLMLVAAWGALAEASRISGGAAAWAQEMTGLQAAMAMEKAMVSAIARAEDSVVAIARVRKGYRGDPTDPSFVPNEFGTGVVIDRKGLIVTNCHVVGDPRENDYFVWVRRRPYRVISIERVTQVKASDPWTDLAVLKVNADNLHPIQFGDTSGLKKGQLVIALGNPYAIARDGEPSATWGIVSNLSRKATSRPTGDDEPEERRSLHQYGTLIQTDAKLNLGTSGGALLNLKGEMIGLTTSLAAMQQYETAAGFAIPVDETFRRVVRSLMKGKQAEFGFLGVGPEDLDAELRRQEITGARVVQVVDGTPAAQAGFQLGDIITHLDSVPVKDASDLMGQLARRPVASTVVATVIRGQRRGREGKRLQLSATLSKRYVSTLRPAFFEHSPPGWRGMQVDYCTAIRGFTEKSRYVDPKGCVAVIDVRRDSPVWNAGLRPGDFISHVGRTRVDSPKQFFNLVASSAGNVSLRLTHAPRGQAVERVISP